MMKFLLYALLFIFCDFSYVHAYEYDVHELERKYVEIRCLSNIITLNHDGKDCGGDSQENLLSSGSMLFYIKNSNIILEYNSKVNFDEIYANYNISDESDEPFLANGNLYLFSNEKNKQYYACFIEWDMNVLRRNKTVYPRVVLIPLAKIKGAVFIATDCEAIFSGRVLGVRAWFPFNVLSLQ